MKVMNILRSVYRYSVWIRVFVLSVSTIGATGAMHAFSHGFVWAQSSMLTQYREASYAVVQRIAQSYGFVMASSEVDEELGDAGSSYQAMCTYEAIKQGVNPALACANMIVESSGNPRAVSHKGAIGLMQVMPENWKACASTCQLTGPKDLRKPRLNICCGVWWLNYELKRHNDNPAHALEAYNGGPDAVRVIRRCGDLNAKCLGGYTESVRHRNKVLVRVARALS